MDKCRIQKSFRFHFLAELGFLIGEENKKGAPAFIRSGSQFLKVAIKEGNSFGACRKWLDPEKE
jgi:hypothetical protein